MFQSKLATKAPSSKVTFMAHTMTSGQAYRSSMQRLLSTNATVKKLFPHETGLKQISTVKTIPKPSSATHIQRSFASNSHQQHQPKDPHQIASDMVKDAPDNRISGTEALASMTPEQRMRNYMTALGLVSFSIGVWYYSIQSVGRADGGVDDLRAEAQEAKDVRDRKSAEEQNAKELAQLDVTMAQYGDEADDVIVAVAAPDEIAHEEESALEETSGKQKVGGRPLWKRVVFFWRRD